VNATRILAIRHGETAWNVDTRIQGQLDIPLNATGRWQAAQVARALADEELCAIYTSDLARAHETAEALGRSVGLPLIKDVGLRERASGVFRGRTFNEIEAEWPEAATRWRKRDPNFGPDGGEALQAFYDRCVATVTRLAAAHPGETIAFVAHGGVMDCLYRLATRIDLQAPRSWLLGNASINRLLYTPEGFTLIGWSDTNHLDGAGRDETNDPGDRVGHAA